MTVKVVRTLHMDLHPRAECYGDSPDTEASNCLFKIDSSPDTAARAKQHVKDNPSHGVLIVRETRSLYEADER